MQNFEDQAAADVNVSVFLSPCDGRWTLLRFRTPRGLYTNAASSGWFLHISLNLKTEATVSVNIQRRAFLNPGDTTFANGPIIHNNLPGNDEAGRRGFEISPGSFCIITIFPKLRWSSK